MFDWQVISGRYNTEVRMMIKTKSTSTSICICSDISAAIVSYCATHLGSVCYTVIRTNEGSKTLSAQTHLRRGCPLDVIGLFLLCSSSTHLQLTGSRLDEGEAKGSDQRFTAASPLQDFIPVRLLGKSTNQDEEIKELIQSPLCSTDQGPVCALIWLLIPFK